MMDNNKHYIDKTEFAAEMEKWRKSAQNIEDRMPSERLGQILLVLHDKILQHKNFAGYRQDLKDEMKSYSIYRILKNGLRTFKFGTSSPFSYFTRAVFVNFYTVLNRYYKKLNQHQEYIKGQLTKLDTRGNPYLEAMIKQFTES